MAGLFPRPKVHCGRCNLEVRGFSTQSADSIRTAEITVAAALIVKNCYGESYDGVLFGGGSAVEKAEEFTGAIQSGQLPGHK